MPKLRTVTHSSTAQVFTERQGVPQVKEEESLLDTIEPSIEEIKAEEKAEESETEES